jgi:hypothetical protein
VDLQLSAGILLITGILFLIIGGVVAPPGIYREQDLEVRLRIIDNHQSRWTTNNILGALGVLATAAGFLTLSIHLWDTQTRALVLAGAVMFVAAAVSMSIQSYLRASNPAVYLAGVSLLEYAWIGLTMAGVLTYGILFIQADYPAWLGYLSIGGAALLAIGTVLINFAVGEVVYLVTLVTGIVLLFRT